MKLSKNLKANRLVQMRGDKVCLAGKRTVHPLGVYYPMPEHIKIITLLFDGTRRVDQMSVPPGIRIYGPANVVVG